MKISAIIQARMGSTRLPGKVLMDIGGRPMLWHVINRLKYSKKLNDIILIISDTKENDVLEEFAKDNKIKYFRGSEENVLSRYYQAAKKFGIDVIVRITADCPLIDPEIVDLVIEKFLNSGANYTSNVLKRTFPRGLDVEVFDFKTLEKVHKQAKKDFQKEHVTLYIYQYPEIFHLLNVENNKNLSYMRWCVDEMKDLELVQEIYNRLYKDDKIFLLKDIVNFFEKSPELLEINKNVKQKEIENEIKEFWDEKAKKYQEQGKATCPDIIDRELEIDNIAKYIKNNTKVLDIGCGNGYSTIKFAKRKNIEITGIDYSDEMIKQANITLDKLDNKLKKRIKFQLEDTLKISYKQEFDIAISCRCLINLADFNKQKKAIENIFNLLKKDGLYIMCENTLDGLNKLNSMRKLVGLNKISMRWHNQYFNEKLLVNFLKQYFEILEINNFASLYFIASRVFNAKLTSQGKKPDYLADINKIAAKLPSVGNYAPSKIFLLKKI